MLCLLDVSILFDGLRIECGASDVLRWFDTCGRRVEWTYCFDTLARHVRPTGVFDVLFVGCNYFFFDGIRMALAACAELLALLRRARGLPGLNLTAVCVLITRARGEIEFECAVCSELEGTRCAELECTLYAELDGSLCVEL